MLIFILHKLKMSYVYCVKVEKLGNLNMKFKLTNTEKNVSFTV